LTAMFVACPPVFEKNVADCQPARANHATPMRTG
jgi:hypothetical protein